MEEGCWHESRKSDRKTSCVNRWRLTRRSRPLRNAAAERQAVSRTRTSVPSHQMKKRHPYAWRTWLRQYLPWFIIDLGIANKGQDCEAVAESIGGTTLTAKRAAVI